MEGIIQDALPYAAGIIGLAVAYGGIKGIIKSSFYQVNEAQRAVVERFGKYNRMAEPGLHTKIPVIERVRYRIIAAEKRDIKPQPVITKDNVEVNVDGLIWVEVGKSDEDVKNSFYKVVDYMGSVEKLVQTNIRDYVARMTFDEALSSREKLAQSLEGVLEDITGKWGVESVRVEIQSIDPPDDLKKSMHSEKAAEQTRRAKVITARGEYEANEHLKQAQILKAQGEKEAAILEAQGVAEARILEANSEAEAIKVVSEAANQYFNGAAVTKEAYETARAVLPHGTIYFVQQGTDLVTILNDAAGVDKKTLATLVNKK